MGTTPQYLLPYPELTDPADVPLDVKELADRLEAVFGPGTVTGQIPVWNQTTKKWEPKLGPGAELAHAEKTSSTSLTTANNSEATSASIITLPSITLDGSTPVLLDFYSPAGQTAPVAGSGVILQLWDGATCLGHAGLVNTGTATAVSAPLRVSRKLTPSAGAHVFAAKAYQLAAGSVVVQGGTGAPGTYQPASFRVTRV